jgi:hypothetical protein
MDSLKRLIRIVAMASGSALAVYLVSSLFPKRYQSFQTLYFPMSQMSSGLASVFGGSGDVSAPSGLGGAFSVPLVATGAQAATGIIQSRAAHRDVVRSLGLDRKWKLSETEAVAVLRDSVTVRLDKNNLLRIEVTASSPDEAVAINRHLFAHLVKRSGELSINVSSRIRRSIETGLKDNELRLADKRLKLTRLMRDRPGGKIEDQAKAYLTARERYEEAKVAAESTKEKLAAAEREARNVLSQPDGVQALEGLASPVGGPRPAAESVYRFLAQESKTRRLALLDAASKFQPDTPEFRAAKRESDNAERLVKQAVEAERQALDRRASPSLAAAKVELASLEKVVTETGKLLDQYRAQIQAAPIVNETLADYQALIDVKSMLTKELERAKLYESSDPSRFEQVDPPEADPKPVSPRPGINALLVFGAVLAFLAVKESARAFRTEANASPDARPS